MPNPDKLTKITVLLGLGLFSLVTGSLSLNILAAEIIQETVPQTIAVSPAFSDEFDGNTLDPTQWKVLKGNPTLNGEQLILPGGATRAELQSKISLQAGFLNLAVESSAWKPQNQSTDSSFGFELWTGANGQCHYGVILIANGHLGILRPQPDANDTCSGDPAQQIYAPISNWEALRADGTIFLTLLWSPGGVTLRVSDGSSASGWATYAGEANPAVPLEVRLNADVDETYLIDYVRVYPIEKNVILLDDFAPQPPPGQPFWPHNRLGGDRGALDVEQGRVEWGPGVVTATITGTMNASTGVWTSLNHPIRDCAPLDFAAIFPPQIKSEFQGRITELHIHIRDGQGAFQAILQNGENSHCPPQTTQWMSDKVSLSGEAQTLQFSLPATLTQIGNLNWQISGDAGDFVVVDRVELIAEVPQLDTPERAFLWSYAMLLANWDPESGLTRDSAGFAANEFDNITASGMQAAAAVMAWRLGFISETSAREIVAKTTEGLLALPDCQGLWPHFVKEGQIISGTEWSSIDSVIALVALLEARQALGLDTTQVEQVLLNIDWKALILGNGSISHGYITACSERIEDKDGDLSGGWRDFGAESWLVNLGYASATGQVATIDSTPPTYNGSGFIDELAWLLVPVPPVTDTFGIDWPGYRDQAADCQLTYYQTSLLPGCLYHHPVTFYESSGLFGLSAAEVPDLSAVPVTQTYQAFGVGGEILPNDGDGVIVPHYAALVAALRPTRAIALWQWLEGQGIFTALNNVESLRCLDEITCNQFVWNALKGSWNLSLQTLGWGRLLAGDEQPLYQAMWANNLLRPGYITISNVCDYGPANAPTSARHNLDDEAADWGVFCEGKPLWAKENVASPSLDGQSLRCAITGGAPYSNVHCYRNFRPEPAANALTLTTSFLFTPATTCNNQGGPSTVQALEFSLSKWHRAKRYELALQWQNVGQGAPQWRYWDPHQPEPERWQPFDPPLTQCLTGGEWRSFSLAGEISGENVHYTGFSINGLSHPLDLTVPATTSLISEGLAIAVQLDGNATQTPYDLFIDQVTFIRQSRVYLPLIMKVASQP